MSSLERVRSELSLRARRMILLADAIRRLGPSWLVHRLRNAFARRTGGLERRSPRTDWPALVACEHGIPSMVASDVLEQWLKNHVSEARSAQVLRHVATLRRRQFDVFGHAVSPVDWHHDPVADVHYDRSAHWSRIVEHETADIKFVWEPSRFGWSFDLARAHLLDPSSGAAELFWDLLDDWCADNLPNTGINWSCGQESSIRLMAVVCTASALRRASNPAHAQQLQRMAWVTAERVEANIEYARSQRNNHHASEAIGLLTSSLLFPGHQATDRWRRLGERHLREVCETLVFPDGGTSQYSTNYHRVFVHNFVWAIQLYRTAGESPPPWLLSANERAARFLAALVEPISGSGPFFGHDDGARILPLSERPHRDIAEDALLALACVAGVQSRQPRLESGAWFGLSVDDGLAAQPRGPGPWFETFPDAGVHTLGCGDIRVYVRAGPYIFRPAQDDQLHCDIWIAGHNVAPDSGTASYRPSSNATGPTDNADAHNGPRASGQPGMERATRFLWAHWSLGSMAQPEIGDDSIRGEFVLVNRGATVVRRVAVRQRDVRIEDSDGSDGPIHCSWRLDRSGFRPGIPFDVAVDYDAELVTERQQTWSPGYGRESVGTATVLSSDRSSCRPLRLIIHDLWK